MHVHLVVLCCLSLFVLFVCALHPWEKALYKCLFIIIIIIIILLNQVLYKTLKLVAKDLDAMSIRLIPSLKRTKEKVYVSESEGDNKVETDRLGLLDGNVPSWRSPSCSLNKPLHWRASRCYK